ncbi:MAG: CHAT domain-containing protein [Caldilineaceae bacterium]
MEATYYNFDLAIEHTEDGYFAHAYGEPFGEARDFFHPPFSEEELEQFLQLIADPAPENAERLALQQQTARSFGERLFHAVFRHNLRSSLQSSYQMVYQQRAHLRLRIQLATTPEFVNLPWEYLYDPGRGEFLALSVHAPSLRYLQLMHRILPLRIDPPLRVLVVMPSPGGYPPLTGESNWLNLLDTLDHLALDGKMKLERLQKPTLLDLQRRLRQQDFHILHFLGHASYDSATQDGSLVFEDEMGRGRLVSGQHLGMLLRDHFALRLVTLEACAVAPIMRQNPYVGVAQSLVQRGLPAAVALQFAPTEATKAAFRNEFYTSISNCTPVDVALTAARRAMQTVDQSTAWGAPMLLMRISDGKLFDDAPTRQPRPIREPFRRATR